MEKTFWETKIEFKDQLTMKDFQICSIATKQRQKDQDEVWLCFKLFPVFCLKINGETKTELEKTERIENLTDFKLFTELTEVMWEIEQRFMQWLDEKKKIQ